jgi:fumarate reductase flavoprotein subunit
VIARADVVVVGGGVAGWSAARAAQDAGVTVALVEKSSDHPGFGNSVLSGGVLHAAYLDPTGHTADELFEWLTQRGGGASRENLVRAWAENVGRARSFLASEGASFVRGRAAEYGWNVLDPQRTVTRALVENFEAVRQCGPYLLLDAMRRRFVERGGYFVRASTAFALVTSEASVAGLRIRRDGVEHVIGADAVVLADGGFQANRDLVRKYITTSYRLRGSEADTGDGLRMGLEVGAEAVNMRFFYGHTLVRDSLENERLWPQPNPEPLIDEGIVVDGTGTRLVDEYRGDHDYSEIADATAGAIAWSRTPGKCWLIFDEQTWTGVARAGTTPMNPTLVDEGGTLISADDLTVLATSCELPVAALADTVAGYNRHCEHGVPLSPARTGRPRGLNGRLYAIPLIAGITFTMGGLLVDEHARVIRANDAEPIAGLYAAGGTMGGLQGGELNRGYAGGWSEASTFGLLAGEHAGRAGKAGQRA